MRRDYVCDFLREFHKRADDPKVRVRINPENLGWVMIWTGSVWVQAHAVQSCFDGKSLGQWRQASRELGLRHQQQAELSEGVVERAFKRVEDINAEQIAKFNVQIPFMTQDDLLREERQLHVGLRIKKEDYPDLGFPSSPDTIGSEIPLTEREPDLFTETAHEETDDTDTETDNNTKPRWGLEEDDQ